MWQLSEEAKVIDQNKYLDRITILIKEQERITKIIDVSRVAIH